MRLLRRDSGRSEDVATMRAPAMILVGDADSVRPAHAVEYFELPDRGWDGSGKPDARLAVTSTIKGVSP